MKTVDLGGVRVSAIGLGTWQFGSREWGYGADYADREAPAILRRAIELEVTFVDTAEAYGFGASERIIGRTLATDRVAAAAARAPARAAELQAEAQEMVSMGVASPAGAPLDPERPPRPFLATKLMPILPVPPVARRRATASRRRLRT